MHHGLSYVSLKLEYAMKTSPHESVVVSAESQDRSFNCADEAMEWLKRVGYERAEGRPVVEVGAEYTAIIIEYERDQVGMEYDEDSTVYLSMTF